MNSVIALPKLLLDRDKILTKMETMDSVIITKRAQCLPFIRLQAAVRLTTPSKSVIILM